MGTDEPDKPFADDDQKARYRRWKESQDEIRKRPPAPPEPTHRWNPTDYDWAWGKKAGIRLD